MPLARATSMSSAPLSAWIGCPLMVSFTVSAICLDRHQLALDRGGRQALLKILAELFDNRDGGHGSGVAERAEGPAEHVLRKLTEKIDVVLAAASVIEALQNLAQPGGAFTAGDAPA